MPTMEMRTPQNEVSLDMVRSLKALGSVEAIRKELDDAFEDIKQFCNREPDEVIRYCSGYSARFSEVRMLIQRVETLHRKWKPVRTTEIEPALEELRQQFAIASRLIAMRELDWRMQMGQP